MNQHLNNVTYLAWCLETVPLDVYTSCQLHQVTLGTIPIQGMLHGLLEGDVQSSTTSAASCIALKRSACRWQMSTMQAEHSGACRGCAHATLHTEGRTAQGGQDQLTSMRSAGALTCWQCSPADRDRLQAGVRGGRHRGLLRGAPDGALGRRRQRERHRWVLSKRPALAWAPCIVCDVPAAAAQLTEKLEGWACGVPSSVGVSQPPLQA
jgi:Acyl-ACP thioesterase